jgi:hypothetical protein
MQYPKLILLIALRDAAIHSGAELFGIVIVP